MNLNDLPSNSFSSKETAKHEADILEERRPIIEGKVVVQKKSPLKRLLREFISDDIPTKNDMVHDIVIPGLKEFIVWGVETAFWGDAHYAPSRNVSVRRGETRISYNDVSSGKPKRQTSQQRSAYSGSAKDIDDIYFSNLAAAKEFAEDMRRYIDDYNVISVAVVFDWLTRPHQYTDRYRGWDNIDNYTIERARINGERMYHLKLPRCIPLDQ